MSIVFSFVHKPLGGSRQGESVGRLAQCACDRLLTHYDILVLVLRIELARISINILHIIHNHCVHIPDARLHTSIQV